MKKRAYEQNDKKKHFLKPHHCTYLFHEHQFKSAALQQSFDYARMVLFISNFAL